MAVVLRSWLSCTERVRDEAIGVRCVVRFDEDAIDDVQNTVRHVARRTVQVARNKTRPIYEYFLQYSRQEARQYFL